MAIVNRLGGYHPIEGRRVASPIFRNSEQFIRECFSLLARGILPSEILDRGCSLVEQIFQCLGERLFDQHLNILIPLVQELVRRNANFKIEIQEIDQGIPCIDLTCQQIAFIYWKQLAKKVTPQEIQLGISFS